MKKVILFVFFYTVGIATAITVSAQQKPHYTQYIQNQYIINPALSGIENYIDFKVSHRHQWAGIADAPVTTYLSIHAPIGKSDYRQTATSFDLKGENPRGKRYWEEYIASEAHHGIGLQVINDVTGPLSNFSAYGTYAYHLGISSRTSISAGLGVGVNRINLNTAKLDFGDIIVDPAVFSSGILDNTRFDISTGVYLYSANYFIGVSVQQVIPQKIDFSNGYIRPTTAKTVPHLFLTAGYRLLISDALNLIPSVMVKYVNPVPTQVEGNLKLLFLDKLWLGASYRHLDGFAGMLGLNVSNTFNLGYSYDYTTSRLNNFSKGTHEIILGFILGGYPDVCPKALW